MTPIAATLSSHPTTAPSATAPAQPLLRSVPNRPAGDFVSRAADAGVAVVSPVATGSLVVDLAGYVVTLDGADLDVSPRQVELLALFLSEPRKVWSREQLHWVCWGDTSPSRRVDVQLCRLRAKTGLDLFRNVRDRGWALRPVA
ncbi:MAG: winged helix-turn-helix domain-containing protein [Mycobacteriales bacterium]|nr:winged helix-turn-helix domain-containing protein [Mycobacteriales bacterium]